MVVNFIQRPTLSVTNVTHLNKPLPLGELHAVVTKGELYTLSRRGSIVFRSKRCLHNSPLLTCETENLKKFAVMYKIHSEAAFTMVSLTDYEVFFIVN